MFGYTYERRWILCESCNKPIWFGNSWRFVKCYECLSRKQKKLISERELQKYYEREQYPIKDRMVYYEHHKNKNKQ